MTPAAYEKLLGVAKSKPERELAMEDDLSVDVISAPASDALVDNIDKLSERDDVEILTESAQLEPGDVRVFKESAQLEPGDVGVFNESAQLEPVVEDPHEFSSNDNIRPGACLHVRRFM